MFVEARDEYALRVHDHVIRVFVVAIDHVFIEAVELPQDLRVHVYWLVRLDPHVSPLHHQNLLKVFILVEISWDYIVVNLHIEERNLVQILIKLSFYVDIIEILNFFTSRVNWADGIFHHVLIYLLIEL